MDEVVVIIDVMFVVVVGRYFKRNFGFIFIVVFYKLSIGY